MFREEYKENPDKKEKDIKDILLNLINKHYSHGKCIDYNTAKKIGLKVETVPKEQWDIIWQIFKIFENETSIK